MDKIEELKGKVGKDPSSKLFVPLAEEYRRAGMLDEAINVLKAGIGRQPKYTSAMVALGKIYFEKGMHAEARAEFEKVVAMVPDNLFAHRKLADIYLKQGERDRAVEQYRRTLKLNPMDEEAQGILEGLTATRPPVEAEAEEAAPLDAVEAAELEEALPSADEDFLLAISGEESAEAEQLTPIEEAEAEEEFLEAFEAEAAPVEELEEAVAEAAAIEEGEEAAPVWEMEEAEAEAAPVEELEEVVAEASPVEEFGIAEAAPLEEAEEATPVWEMEEAEAEAMPVEELEEVVAEAAPVEEIEEAMAFEEVGFQELAAVVGEEKSEMQEAEEYVASGEYARAAAIYRKTLAADPENKKAKQSLQDIESLLRLMGMGKEVIINRLEAFLRALMKRKDEFYRNA